MQEITQRNIAVRLYNNQKFGTTYGKGLYRNAPFNGTADFKYPSVKYLLDFYEYSNFENRAKTDGQMEILRNLDISADKLYSWIKRHIKGSKQHPAVNGVAFIDLLSLDLTIMIADTEFEIEDVWYLKAMACKQNNSQQKPPQFLATNCELADW